VRIYYPCCAKYIISLIVNCAIKSKILFQTLEVQGTFFTNKIIVIRTEGKTTVMKQEKLI